jgi:hypothetical protein
MVVENSLRKPAPVVVASAQKEDPVGGDAHGPNVCICHGSVMEKVLTGPEQGVEFAEDGGLLSTGAAPKLNPFFGEPI